MPAGEQPTADGALSRDQVLDELEFLAAVEHALLVEQWSLAYAFGHDLPPEAGGATTDLGREAAAKFAMIADTGAISRLRAINLGLAEAGREPDFSRATAVSSPSVAEIALGPPTLAEPERLVGRQQAIAAAIEERFAALRPAVTSDPLFEGHLLQHLREVILQDGPNHSALLALVLEVLEDPVPAELLRATRREPADAFEDRLLKASDRAYRTYLLALLTRCTSVFDSHGALIPNSFFIGRDFQALAERFQETLDDINRLLVQRGLLPPFRLVVPFHTFEPPGGAPPT